MARELNVNANTPPKTGSIALESLSGMVERVTFQSEESGFSVLKVKAKGFRDLVAVVGVMPLVTAGEWIEAGGRWEVDREHGQQFKVETINATRPDTLEGSGADRPGREAHV